VEPRRPRRRVEDEDSGRVQEEGRMVFLLLVLLLPGAPPFVSFLSSSPEAEEEGKGKGGGGEKSDVGMRGSLGRCGGRLS